MAMTPPPRMLSYWDILKRDKTLTDREQKRLYCKYMKDVEKSRTVHHRSSIDNDGLSGVGFLALANLFGFWGD